MTPVETIIAQLRQPVQPAHGVWQIYANVQQALATLIEQNEKIIELLGPTKPEDESAMLIPGTPFKK